MARDYSLLNKSELKITLQRLMTNLEDMEETTAFYYANSAAHINGGEVLKDEEALMELKSDISKIEELMRRMEAYIA